MCIYKGLLFPLVGVQVPLEPGHVGQRLVLVQGPRLDHGFLENNRLRHHLHFLLPRSRREHVQNRQRHRIMLLLHSGNNPLRRERNLRTLRNLGNDLRNLGDNRGGGFRVGNGIVGVGVSVVASPHVVVNVVGTVVVALAVAVAVAVVVVVVGEGDGDEESEEEERLCHWIINIGIKMLFEMFDYGGDFKGFFWGIWGGGNGARVFYGVMGVIIGVWVIGVDL